MSSATELAAWLAGIPTGGPNNDGRYPLTYADGLTYLVYCPAAQALNPALSEEPIEVFANTASTAAATATAESTEAQQASLDAQTYAANAFISAADAQTAKVDALSFAGSANSASTVAQTAAANALNSETYSATSASNAASSAAAAAASAAVYPGDLASKAPLASPTFTGIVAAPTFRLPVDGAMYFDGATYSRYLYYNGTSYQLAGAHLFVNGSAVWTGANFDPTLKANLAGATFTGQVDVNSGSMRVRGFGNAADGVLYMGDVATDNYIYKAGSNFIFKAGTRTWNLNSASGDIYTTANLSIANYAPLASPALTGVPTTSTPAAGDNTSKIASTAFVLRDFITKIGNYLTGNNANDTPDNYLGSVADAVGNNGPESSWTNIISFGSGGGTAGLYQHQIAASWFNDTLYTRAKNGTTTYGSWKKIWHSGNDGAGSGLDADNIRGVPGNWFVNGDNATATGTSDDMNLPAKSGFYQSPTGINGPGTVTWHWYIHHEHTSTGYGFQFANLINSDDFHVRTRSGGVWASWKKLWHTGNFTPTNYALLAGATFTGAVNGPGFYPTSSAGAHLTGNGSGAAANGPWYFNARPIVLSADAAAWVTQSRTFVQSADPGAQAADGDLWIW